LSSSADASARSCRTAPEKRNACGCSLWPYWRDVSATRRQESMDIDIRRADSADLPGLVTSSAALFAEDGVSRDRLRNAEWPQDHGRAWIEGLLAAPDALVLVAVDLDGDVVGHLIGCF